MRKRKVLFISSEAVPLAKAGGMGDVVGALAPVLNQKGFDVRIALPLYQSIRNEYSDDLQFLGWHMVRMGWRTLYCGVLKLVVNDQIFYLFDNETYFNHEQIYLDYTFDIERYSFFQRAVLESLDHPMDFMPDILHLNDWQTGMIPCLLEAHYRPYGRLDSIKTILTIHNLKYQGIHGRERIADLMDMPDRFMTEEGILRDGVPNFMKAGIVYADHVTTVSPSYAEEIKLDFYGEGLHELLQRNAYKLTGILNGIDITQYDPETDPVITDRYSVDDWQTGKAHCKTAVQTELGLHVSARTPLIAMVTRLVDQKGLDLLLHVLDDLLDGSCQLIVLGTGQPHYEQALKAAAQRHPDAMAACLTFDESLSRRIYAGADLFLMPSIFEPCGLSQMIAMRYGTIPVVRETGGLRDTVNPYNQYTGSGNGFSFKNINAHEMLFITRYACDVYRHMPQAWQALVRTAMNQNFFWSRSADTYASLYEMVLSQPSNRPIS